MMEKAQPALKKLLTGIRTLKEIPVKAQKEEESYSESFQCLRKYIEIINRILIEIWMLKHSGKVPDGDEEHIFFFFFEIGKRQSYYEVAENLAKSCSNVLQKVGLISDKLGYLVQDLSEQNIKGVTWFLLAAYSNMQEEPRMWLSNGLLKRSGM